MRVMIEQGEAGNFVNRIFQVESKGRDTCWVVTHGDDWKMVFGRKSNALAEFARLQGLA